MSNFKLDQLATVFSGESIRKKITTSPTPDTYIIQLKDVYTDAKLCWDDVIHAKLSDFIKNPHKANYLLDGDIIFKARGKHHIAAVVTNCLQNTVVSPHLFSIRIKEDSEVLPEFVAWQINQIPAQQHLLKHAEGSLVAGVRKSVLENLPLDIPSLKTQRKVVEAHQIWYEQKQVLINLLANHEAYQHAIAQQFLIGQDR